MKILKFFIFFLLFNISAFGNNQKYDVLFINSYHQGLKWTDSIVSGVNSVLLDQPDLNLSYEYLDAKRIYDDEYLEAVKNTLKIKAKKTKIDLIIVSDNVALDFGFFGFNFQRIFDSF